MKLSPPLVSVTSLSLDFFLAFLCPYLQFPSGSDDKASVCNAGDPGSIPGLGRSPEQGKRPALKLNIQKMKIVASGTVTSWQINGETMEIVTNFIFLGSKITVDGDCSHKIKRPSPLEEKL